MIRNNNHNRELTRNGKEDNIMNIIKCVMYLSMMSLCVMPIVGAGTNSSGTNLQGFQHLSDVKLFNGTGLIPDSIVNNALIPNGFFDKLEKSNFSKEVLSNVQNNTFPKLKKENKYSQNSIQKGDITFNGNSEIWNESVDGTIYGQIVDDLNGDGTNDTLATISRYDLNTGNYYYTLEAKKGTDGSVMWEDTISGSDIWSYAQPMGDLSGDGLNDILITTESYDSVTGYGYKFEARKGKDGSVLWQENYNSNGEYVSTYTTADVNGGRINDILMEIHDYRLDQTTLKVKVGSGATLWQETVPGYEYFITGNFGDLNGDRLNDLLVLDSYTGIFSARKGYDGSYLWSLRENSPSVYPLGDINRDGKNDILITDYNYPSYTKSLSVVNGNDGSNIWTYTTPGSSVWLSAQPAGDLNNDGITDILVDMRDYNASVETLSAVRGDNGNNLWQESVYGNDYISVYRPIGDINGDHFDYVLVETDNYYNGIDTYNLEIKRGVDGNVLWQESCVCYMGAYLVGDVNGDGLDDILIKEQNNNPSSNILKMKRGKDGVELWRDQYPGNVYISVNSVNYNCNGYICKDSIGDLSGDTLKDILVNIDTGDGSYNAIQARKGIDGAHIWNATSYDYIWVGNTNKNNDLNGDGVDDVLLGSYDTMYAITADTSTVEFDMGNYNVKSGRNVSIPLMMTASKNVGSLQLNISFNGRSVRVDKVSPGDSIGSGILNYRIDNNSGNVTIAAMSTTGFPDGTIANIEFNATGPTMYTDLIPKVEDVTDVNNVHFAIVKKSPGSITIYTRIKGDVNDDGIITASDALLYLRYSVGQDTSPYHIDANDDVTCDGRITAADALRVLRKATGQPIDLNTCP